MREEIKRIIEEYSEEYLGGYTAIPIESYSDLTDSLEALFIEMNTKPAKIEVPPIYKNIIDYLNKVTGQGFRYAKAHKTVIEARLKEKFIFDDFKAVVDVKSKQWLGTKQQMYLRPSTLFQASKMDGYLQESKMKIILTNDEKSTAERAFDTVEKFFPFDN